MTTSFGTMTLAQAIENWREWLRSVVNRGYLPPDLVLSGLSDIALDAGVRPVDAFPVELLLKLAEAKRRCDNSIRIDFTVVELVEAANASLSKLVRS